MFILEWFGFKLTNVHLLRTIVLLLVAHCVQVTGYDFNFNSPPVFDFKRELFIRENETIGARITTVRTIDAEGDMITFSLEPGPFLDGSKYLRIDDRTGDVYLKESLTGQGGKDMYVYIKAFDGHQTSKIEAFVRVISSQRQSETVDVRINRVNKPVSWLAFEQAGGMPSASKPADTAFITPGPVALDKTTTVKPARLPPVNRLNNVNATDRGGEKKKKNSKPSESSVFNEVVINQLVLIIAGVAGFFAFVILLVSYKCRSSARTPRNVLKSFSHKIINNNKLDSVETIASYDPDFKGVLFHSKSLSSNESSETDDRLEMPRHHLKFIHILGEGCFGQVWKCEAIFTSGSKPGSTQVVAVKTLKENSTQKEKKDLVEELKVMKRLDAHPNVVKLLGCCTDKDPVFLVMEYVPYGKLQTYLRNCRADNQYNGLYDREKLTSRDLVSFAHQVARGMEYLSSKGVIHRDLAARNVLLANDKVCKIADFGFARFDHIYERKSEGRLPIRWMAVESLTDFVFTTQSDVWSFGILMWEIVTLGWTPYPGMTANEVIRKVTRENYRMEKPEHCKREMYNIMYYCWDQDPNQRPTFSELLEFLAKIIYSENDYIELDRFPDHAYYNILKQENSSEKL